MTTEYIGRENFTKEHLESLSMPIPECGCWIWTRAVDNHGYACIHKDRVHRLSWILYNGPIPKGMCILHKCDIPSCVNPRHLLLGTKKDNTHDMVKKGRNKPSNLKGEAHGMCKLTAEQAKNIMKDPRSQRQIASLYNISQVQVFRIKHKVSWASVN